MGAARSRASRRGRRPRRPAEPPANGHPPDSHLRRGQDPSLRTVPLTGAHANPRAGHARPLPCGGPGTAARVNPTAFPYLPIRRAGCPHPAATSRCRQHPGRDESLHYSPCLPPWGKVAPQGRMRGRLPLPPISGQTVRGRRPRRPAEACVGALPRVTTRGDSHCRQHPRRGQDPSLQAEPLTGAHANLRAGHARPLPGNNPTHLYTT